MMLNRCVNRLPRAGRLSAVAVLALAGSFPAPAHAGPPTICHPVAIGEARSLPMGRDLMDLARTYDADNVIKDTLAILKTAEPPLVRMETLRRATLYVQKNKARAHELLGDLAFIALDAEAAGKADYSARAWFDAGYLAACYQQIGLDIDWNPGVAEGVHGYAWIGRALELSKGDPEMEYGAALAMLPEARARSRDIKPADRELYNGHLRRAAARAAKDSPLEVNLAAHLEGWGRSLQQVRAEARASADVAGQK